MTSNETLQGAPFVLVAAGLLGLLAASLLVRWYRRSVVRLMATGMPVASVPFRAASAPAASPTPDAPSAANPDPRSAATAPAGDAVLAELDARVAMHTGITVAAGVFVGVTYAGLFLFWNGLAVLPLRYTFLALVFSWPAVPGVWVASGDLRRTAWTAAILLLTPLVVAAAAGTGPLTALAAWALFNAVASLVVVAFFTRPFRAIGVCVLGVALFALVGGLAAIGLLGSPDAEQAAVTIGQAMGIPDGGLVFWGTLVLGFVVAGGLAVAVFALLGRWYARQLFSDHMLLLGSLCLVFCLDYVSSVGLGEPVLFLTGLALFIVLAILVIGAFHWLVHDVAHPRRLLVLRVFGHRDSAALLAAVGERWRHIGPVCMIGGPDLATTNVEPDEFLTFLGGRLRRMFVSGPADLGERLRTLATRADPDGRYRVQEVFCLDSAWRSAVDALLERSDVVLLDLRGLTSQRAGTLHELDVLARTGALTRTVAVVDATTDLALVDAVVAGAGARRPATVHLTRRDARAVVVALASRLAPG